MCIAEGGKRRLQVKQGGEEECVCLAFRVKKMVPLAPKKERGLTIAYKKNFFGKAYEAESQTLR